jgi:hypothetical protein
VPIKDAKGRAEYEQKRRTRNKTWYTEYNKRYAKERMYRLRKYGVSIAQFLFTWQLQGGKCAICREAFSAASDAVVDHDHATNKFRQLLCGVCNKGLGLFNDCPQILIRASEYLKNHNK